MPPHKHQVPALRPPEPALMHTGPIDADVVVIGSARLRGLAKAP
jgi:hypothetical protein